MTRTPPLTKDVVGLAAAFLGSSVIHLARPQVFEPSVPRQLPVPARQVVTWSGVVEIACGVGLLVPRTRRVTGLASAALLVSIWPANAQMLLTAHRRAQRDPGDRRKQVERAAMLVRMPLQVPLIRIALRAAGR